MWEKICCILAAIVVIFIAGLLVKKQNDLTEKSKELSDEVTNNLGDAANEIEILTGEEITDYSLTHLENSMESLNKRFCNVKIKKPKLERKTKANDKRKKNSANE